MASVYVNNLVINSGSNFNQGFNLEGSFTGVALDLSSYSVSAQMRKWSGSSTSINFNTEIESPPTNGRIVLSLSSQQTSSIKPGRYVYDIVITDNFGVKTRVVEGMALVREGVTR